jgi:hypothetical protein
MKIPIIHKKDDLQLIINLCSSLVINSVECLDYEDYYNLQAYCKAIRSRKESLSWRRTRSKEISFQVDINSLRSLNKLHDLNYTYFDNPDNIYQDLMITAILEQYNKHKQNSVYDPFNH